MEKIVVTTSGERLDNYLSNLLEMTRSQIKKNINNIKVNGENVKCGYILKEEDIITYEFEEEIDLEKQNIPLDIVYEDDKIIVINKANGMVVHPGAGNKNGTLVNALLYRQTALSDINGDVRPGIVHRIDAFTTGLLVVAKNNEVHNFLKEQIQNKICKRKYYALVWGIIKNDTGTIDAPIGRDPNNRLKMKVTDVNAKDAVTHFKVLKRYSNVTLIELSLETGRTHQIRCHMDYIGYPIVNDPVYGNNKIIDETGQCLHAFELEFIHPETKKVVKFNAPLPECFINIQKKIEVGDL